MSNAASDVNGSSSNGNGAASAQAASSTTKTIYLIRHAESDENERLASFHNMCSTIYKLQLPQKKDFTGSLGLVNIPKMFDSQLSDVGRDQIAHMARVLERSDFVRRQQIQLVVHSPLIRARETCQGMLQCLAPNLKPDTVQRVLELDLLMEKTPLEWIPGNHGSLIRRLRELEDWVAAQPETIVALVGHSQFFKALLELDYKFGNCDVMEIQFNGDSPDQKWTNLKEFHLCRLSSTSDVVETKTDDANSNAKDDESS